MVEEKETRENRERGSRGSIVGGQVFSSVSSTSYRRKARPITYDSHCLEYIIKRRSKVSLPSPRSRSMATSRGRKRKKKKEISNRKLYFFLPASPRNSPLRLTSNHQSLFLFGLAHFRIFEIRCFFADDSNEKPETSSKSFDRPYSRIVKRTSRRRWRRRLGRRKVGQLSADESNRPSRSQRFIPGREPSLIYDAGNRRNGSRLVWFPLIDRSERIINVDSPEL